MPRKCSVCEHIQVKDIDESLVNGTGLRKIAERFSLSTTAVHRHKKHLNGTLIKAREVMKITHADNLLEQVKYLQEKSLHILSKAEEIGDYRACTSAINEARKCLELLGKLAGELQDGQTVNVIVSPQWVELRTTIIEALEPHPEAKFAVLGALQGKLNG